MLSLYPSVEEIKSKALELGWDDASITSASIPHEDIQAYSDWVAAGFHAEMEYMKNELRCAPTELLPGAQTAIIFVSYYKDDEESFNEKKGVIASYARGKDYHNVHHRRLKKFCHWLKERVPDESFECKRFSDSTPILEKALAVKAGLGWFGKNTLLIHKQFGTYTLLSGVLTTLRLEDLPAHPRLPRCGSCTRCLDSCPTQALTPYALDANKCLSYHLIESKTEIPQEIAQKNPGYIFGCDICQSVCPHNTRKPLSHSTEFGRDEGIGASLSLEDLSQIEQSPELLFGTPLKRAGAKRMKNTLESLISKRYPESERA